ncbi:recombinase family protein [Nocardia xishanensis]
MGSEPACGIYGTKPDMSALCGTVPDVTRFGYARVSTRGQKDDYQIDALTAAGCERIWVDKASGKLARRPEWDKCFEHLRRKRPTRSAPTPMPRETTSTWRW